MCLSCPFCPTNSQGDHAGVVAVPGELPLAQLPEEGATSAHVLSILAMVNEKFREGVPAWTCFRQRSGPPVRRVCLEESRSEGERCRAGRHGLRRIQL